jgi:hypothetical protein
MATPERVSSMKTEAADLLSVLGTALEEIKADSKVTCDKVDIEVPLVRIATNAASIHFFQQNALEKQWFSQFFSNELMLRNLSTEEHRDTMSCLTRIIEREATSVRQTQLTSY